MDKTLWYVTKYFTPQTSTSFGGRGHSIMKEMAKLGYRVTVISSDSNNLSDIPTVQGNCSVTEGFGYKLIFLKTYKYSIAKSAKRILSWFDFEWRLFNFDTKTFAPPDFVIISSLSLLTIFYGLFLKRKYKCKLVFEVRDIWPLTIVEEGGFSNKNPFVVFLGIVEKIAYRLSDHIVGTMPNLEAHVKNVSSKYHAPVSCVPMGIDLDVADDSLPLPEGYEQQYLSDKYFNVVYAGTIGITNALTPFLEAAESMKGEQSIRFVIIGDGALRSKYKAQYDLPNLLFAPKIKRNMVSSALAKADLLYFSTHKSKVWDYGLSLNKMIDYMKAGKPIIASYSGFPSMINEAKCGKFIPANDTETLIRTIYEYTKIPKLEREEVGNLGKVWLFENRSFARLALIYDKILKEI